MEAVDPLLLTHLRHDRFNIAAAQISLGLNKSLDLGVL
jgi:hypothetical protein